MNSLQFIGQDQAELTLEQYQLIEDAVITAARKPLVGRTVAPIRELNNFGITELKVYTQSQMTGASIGMAMVQGAADVVGLTPGTLSIPAIWKDFTIYFRDMESSRRIGIPLDTSLASEAGRVVAETEEELIWEKAGPYNGFMNATGRQRLVREHGQLQQMRTRTFLTQSLTLKAKVTVANQFLSCLRHRRRISVFQSEQLQTRS